MNNKKLEVWFLRIGVFGTFIGHGFYAINIKPEWLKLITSIGFSKENAVFLMPIIGVLDIIVAIMVILKPTRYLLMWAAFWCFLTALSRVTAGDSILELLERFSNIACPLALLYVYTRKTEFTE